MKKIILLFLFLLLLLVIVVFKPHRISYTGTTAPEPTQTAVPSDSESVKAVSDTIGSFFGKYEFCMKNPPAEAQGKVSEYCRNNSGLTTAAFAGNLEKGGTAKAGADPVVCAQDFPEQIMVSPDIRIAGTHATGFADEKFGPKEIAPQVELVSENGIWKIDTILCPQP